MGSLGLCDVLERERRSREAFLRRVREKEEERRLARSYVCAFESVRCVSRSRAERVKLARAIEKNTTLFEFMEEKND